MTDEMDYAAAASVGGLKGAGHGDTKSVTECLNCGAPVSQRYCGQCGQLQDTFKRPLVSLIREGASDLFSIDSRSARTIPPLLFRPGRITRNYIDGKRTCYVPPFRLYLLTSLLFFFCLFAFSGLGASVEEMAADWEIRAGEQTETVVDEAIEQAPAAPNATGGNSVRISGEQIEATVVQLLQEPKRLVMLIQAWTPRVVILLVPLTVIGLALVYPFKKNIFLYDHIIVALHFQTFMFFLLGAIWLAPESWTNNILFVSMFIVAPLYFYRMQRVVYQGGRWLTIGRTFLLWTASMIVSALTILGIASAVIAAA